MIRDVSPTLYGLMFAGGFFFGMLLLLDVGRRIGTRRLARDPEGARLGVGVVEGAVFGLLGLLMAFTFSRAASRFDERRQLIIDEANTIRTAWQHLDLLPAGEKASFQELFRQYLDSRLATYQKLPDIGAAKAELAHSIKLQGEIWANAAAGSREAGLPPNRAQLLPALDQMFDITTRRVEATKAHAPLIVFAMLAAVGLAASLLAGYGMAGAKSRSWLHSIGFAAVIALTVFVILDFEFPRLGLITLRGSDGVLIELRKSMG